MKTRTPDPIEPINDAEWQLQEQARLKRPAAEGSGDELDAYRAIDHALRTPPASALPADFAASMARMAAQQRVVRDDGFERNLIRILVAVLGISGGVALAITAGELLPAVAASVIELGGETLNWSGAALGCIGLSWLCSRMLRLERRPTSH
jgi:hypothetical protein